MAAAESALSEMRICRQASKQVGRQAEITLSGKRSCKLAMSRLAGKQVGRQSCDIIGQTRCRVKLGIRVWGCDGRNVGVLCDGVWHDAMVYAVM